MTDTDDDDREDTIPDALTYVDDGDLLAIEDDGAVGDVRRVGRGMYDYLLSDRADGDDEIQALARFFRLW